MNRFDSLTEFPSYSLSDKWFMSVIGMVPCPKRILVMNDFTFQLVCNGAENGASFCSIFSENRDKVYSVFHYRPDLKLRLYFLDFGQGCLQMDTLIEI